MSVVNDDRVVGVRAGGNTRRETSCGVDGGEVSDCVFVTDVGSGALTTENQKSPSLQLEITDGMTTDTKTSVSTGVYLSYGLT